MTIQKMRVSPYGVNDELLSVEVNLLNDQMPAFVDGEDGGLYEPTTPIAVGGNGLTCTTFFSTSAACSTLLDGTVVFPNGFSCTGTATTTFGNNSVSIGSGGELTAYCDSFFNGDVNFTYDSGGPTVFQCDKPTAFARNVGCSGLVTCSNGIRVAAGSTQLETSTVISGALTISNSITHGGTAHVVSRVILPSNVDQVFGVASGSVETSGGEVIVRYGSGIGANTYTITSTGATFGCRMLWSSFDNVSAMTLQRDDSTLICRVKSGAATTDGARAAPATGFYAWVELVFTGTWQILRGWSA